MLKNHFGYYISLFLILILGFFIAYGSQDKEFQFEVTVLTAFLYVGWGILHHAINHDLSAKIVLEYVLMGALGVSLIFFLLKGGFGI